MGEDMEEDKDDIGGYGDVGSGGDDDGYRDEDYISNSNRIDRWLSRNDRWLSFRLLSLM